MGYYRAGQLSTPWGNWEEFFQGSKEAEAHLLGPLRESQMAYYRAGQDAASEYMISEGQLRHQRGRMAMVPSGGGEELASAGAVLGEGAYGPRRRRMNAMNVRAARRAIRRLTSFAHIARRIYAFTHPSKARGHFKMHRKRRR